MIHWSYYTSFYGHEEDWVKLKWTEKAGTTRKSGILKNKNKTILSKEKFVSRHNKACCILYFDPWQQEKHVKKPTTLTYCRLFLGVGGERNKKEKKKSGWGL